MKALEDKADALAAHARLFIRAERGDVAPFERVGAGVGPVEQAEQVEQGRFSGAGRPHDGDVLAVADDEVEAAQGVHLAVAEAEGACDAAKLDERGAHHGAVPRAALLSSLL